MGKLKKLWQEFKAFVMRGNVVDMAVAVIIGAAFNAIVTSLTNDIIKPLINYATGGADGAGLVTMLREAHTEDGSIDLANSIYIDWGTFIMKIVDFLIIAIVLFVILKVYMSLKNAGDKAKEKAKLRTEKLKEKLKKQGMSEEEAQAQAEAQVVEEAAAPAEPPKPTTDELLTQIRDLLAAQQTTASSAEETSVKTEE